MPLCHFHVCTSFFSSGTSLAPSPVTSLVPSPNSSASSSSRLTVLATVLLISVVLIVLVIVGVFTVVCLRQRRRTLKPELHEKDKSWLWADKLCGGQFITVTTYKKFGPLCKVCMYYLNSGYSCMAEFEWYVGNSWQAALDRPGVSGSVPSLHGSEFPVNFAAMEMLSSKCFVAWHSPFHLITGIQWKSSSACDFWFSDKIKRFTSYLNATSHE